VAADPAAWRGRNPTKGRAEGGARGEAAHDAGGERDRGEAAGEPEAEDRGAEPPAAHPALDEGRHAGPGGGTLRGVDAHDGNAVTQRSRGAEGMPQ
jgi:hypothetical protein